MVCLTVASRLANGAIENGESPESRVHARKGGKVAQNSLTSGLIQINRNSTHLIDSYDAMRAAVPKIAACRE
jgi:hypothetical protein